MQSNVENLGGLERRLDISVSHETVDKEVESRLKKLAKTTKLHGFRPGKVPVKIVTQKYGVEVKQDVLSSEIQKAFNEAVKELDLKIAGSPRFDAAESGDNEQGYYQFKVVFEVYPEIALGDLSQQTVEKPVVAIEASNIDKTIEMIQKKQVQYQPTEQPAKAEDQVNIDFHGTVDGKDFAGGKAEKVSLIVGEGRFLKDFEDGLVGLESGQNKSIEVAFPDDYRSEELAGKTVVFEIQVNEVAAPILPEIDQEFAKLLGIPDGDLEKMRASIKQDLEREVDKRVKSKIKEQIMQCFLNSITFEAPNVLVNQEIQRLQKETQENLESQGMKPKDIQLNADMFKEKAVDRIKLGLILNELVKTHNLKATPEKVRSIVEEAAQNYENPEQVVNWHYASAERLQDAQALALEDNVVQWAQQQVKLVEKVLTFDEIMGIT